MGSLRADAAKRRAAARALERAATELEESAAAMRAQAATERGTSERLDHMARMPEALRTIRARIAQGDSDAIAIEHAAHAYSFEAGTLAYYLAAEERHRYAAFKWRRDREIMRLAWAGKNNAQIGAVVRMKPKSVSRIVALHLRNGLPKRRAIALMVAIPDAAAAQLPPATLRLP